MLPDAMLTMEKRGYLFKDVDGGVHDAGVNVSWFFETETELVGHRGRTDELREQSH
jgi:hypothetical protein